MIDTMQDTSAFGIFGVFFVLLGTGLILDGDWWWRGVGLIALGAYCLSGAARAKGTLTS